MDKIAIISDIHANKSALNAVLFDINAKHINNIICLGDIVTKCANPDIVIDLIKSKCNIVLKGNCDEVMASSTALEKKYWTRLKIGENRAQYLASLPLIYEFYFSGYFIRLFHASPFSLSHIFNPMFSNAENKYSSIELLNPLDLFVNTEFIGKTSLDSTPDIIGYGHIHTPNIMRIKNKTIFNVGSVGVPIEMYNECNLNDFTNRFSTVASYTILEGSLDSKTLSPISISIVRVPYDISSEIMDLEHSDMPGKENIILNLKTASTNL